MEISLLPHFLYFLQKRKGKEEREEEEKRRKEKRLSLETGIYIKNEKVVWYGYMEYMYICLYKNKKMMIEKSCCCLPTRLISLLMSKTSAKQSRAEQSI